MTSLAADILFAVCIFGLSCVIVALAIWAIVEIYVYTTVFAEWQKAKREERRGN